MSLLLVRLDDRLIHGQVVVGWGRALKAEQILLIDDRVAADEWEREIYQMGLPPEIDVQFCTVAAARSALDGWAESPKRTIVLFADVDTLFRVCHASEIVRQVNIGAVHERDGRRKRLPYVFLSDQEAQRLRELAENGVSMSAQDLPTTRPVPIEEFL